MNAIEIPKSLIPMSQKADFFEWARDGGYDESHFNRYDSKSRALEETYLEAVGSQQHSNDARPS